jgi:hypothetical protein
VRRRGLHRSSAATSGGARADLIDFFRTFDSPTGPPLRLARRIAELDTAPTRRAKRSGRARGGLRLIGAIAMLRKQASPIPIRSRCRRALGACRRLGFKASTRADAHLSDALRLPKRERAR